jgi:hypothetical protein
MKNKKILLLLLIFYLTLFIFFVSAADQYESPVVIISPITSALGGPHVTMNDGFSTMMNNPASFFSTEPEFSISEVTIGVKGPVFDIADLIISGDYLAGVLDLMQGLYAGLDILGPLSFGYVGEGLGFGIYTNTYSTIAATGPLTVRADLGSEVILAGGYAMRFPLPDKHILDAGMVLKGTFRGELSFEESALNVLSIGLDTLTTEPFNFITGIGFDLGLRYSYLDLITIGLVGRDVYSPTLNNVYTNVNDFIAGSTPVAMYQTVPFSLDFGVMYSPDLETKNLFISDLKIYVDYYDIFDFWLYPELAVNPLLHLGIGAEVSMLSILDLRAGFNEGLFSAGLGLDLYYFTMNFSMFGTELSTDPGLQPVYNMQLGFEFRI